MFPLCNGFRLLLSMAIDGPITRNHCSLCVHPLNFTQVASQKKHRGLPGQIKLSESALLGLLILIETSFLFRRIEGPLTLKFDRATLPFLKIGRHLWTILKSTENFQH